MKIDYSRRQVELQGGTKPPTLISDWLNCSTDWSISLTPDSDLQGKWKSSNAGRILKIWIHCDIGTREIEEKSHIDVIFTHNFKVNWSGGGKVPWTRKRGGKSIF